jgi:hypothetical protein
MFAVAGLSGCMFNPNRQFWVYGGSPTAQVRLVVDTAEVRRLLANEDAGEEVVDRFWSQHSRIEGQERVKDMAAHPDLYPPGRATFLTAMANASGFYVPGKSFCIIVQSSKSRCGSSPFHTIFYRLVRITSGPARGKEGWVCGPAQLYP